MEDVKQLITASGGAAGFSRRFRVIWATQNGMNWLVNETSSDIERMVDKFTLFTKKNLRLLTANKNRIVCD